MDKYFPTSFRWFLSVLLPYWEEIFPFLWNIAAISVLLEHVLKLSVGGKLFLPVTKWNNSWMGEAIYGHLIKESSWWKIQAWLYPLVSFLTQPPSCLPLRALFPFILDLETLDHWTKPQEGLSEDPLTNPGGIWYTDGRSFVLDGKRRAGYAVVSNLETIGANKPLPPGTSAQLIELIALIQALELGKGRSIATYTDSKYAFLVLHAHAAIWKERGHLITRGSPIKYGDQILRLLEAVHLPTEVSISYCKGHQKGSTEVAWGKQATDQAAESAALQNNDLLGVSTLVPQTNLPETLSYTEGETLKAKSEGFQEDHMRWFHKEGLLFLPGNLQWKLVNSLHATTHLGEKALQRLLERPFRRTSLQTTLRQVSHFPIKKPPRSSKTPASPASPKTWDLPGRGMADGLHPDASF